MRRRPVIEKAVAAFLDEARQGYPEAVHVLPFPREQGFLTDSDLQSGDVFQRAILMDTLHAIQVHGFQDVSLLIDHEADYLLSRQQTDPPGGWRYFPDLKELPADADDLAQCIRALMAAGRSREARAAAAQPLQTLLHDCRLDSGLYETWIVPQTENAETARQRWWIRNAWGRGPDCEVIANLVIALHMLDAQEYAAEIAECRTRLAAMQATDGSWPSSWYHGPYYPGLVCSRALGFDAPESRRWADRLRQSQHADGGWGSGLESDAVSTALALLVLDQADAAVSAGCAYLESHQMDDGLWPGVLWIRMELGRAEGRIRTVLSYGSRVIGAGYALQALIKHTRRS